jgi:hypothetical protein
MIVGFFCCERMGWQRPVIEGIIAYYGVKVKKNHPMDWVVWRLRWLFAEVEDGADFAEEA